MAGRAHWNPEWDRIRSLWPDHLGLARGKYLPVRLASRGSSHCVSTFILGYDRSMFPGPGGYLLEGLPDVLAVFEESEVRQGWDDGATGVAVADLFMHGRPYPASPRHALRRAVADWEELGYTPEVGIELEAYVFTQGPDGPEPYDTPSSMVYGTGLGSDPARVITSVVRTAEASGIPMESVNAEFDEGQFELTLEHRDAMTAADDAFLFRVLARETVLAATDAAGRPLGLDLTFLGKPFAGISGSGVHVNFSLADGEGRNALADPGAPDGLSALAHLCLAGLVARHQPMTALAAPTVNAYRRLRPGELNGYWANWGYAHRCVCNRVPETSGPGVRIENRLGDGAANIHTVIATVLQAARLGVVEGLDSPEPLTGDGFEEINTDVHSARSLSEALDHLEGDAALREAVGAELVDNFAANKREEWGRYAAAVAPADPAAVEEITDWELAEYLPYH